MGEIFQGAGVQALIPRGKMQLSTDPVELVLRDDRRAEHLEYLGGTAARMGEHDPHRALSLQGYGVERLRRGVLGGQADIPEQHMCPPNRRSGLIERQCDGLLDTCRLHTGAQRSEEELDEVLGLQRCDTGKQGTQQLRPLPRANFAKLP